MQSVLFSSILKYILVNPIPEHNAKCFCFFSNHSWVYVYCMIYLVQSQCSSSYITSIYRALREAHRFTSIPVCRYNSALLRTTIHWSLVLTTPLIISWSIQYPNTMQSAFVSFQITLGFMYIVWSTLYNHNVHRAISPLYIELSERHTDLHQYQYADIIQHCYVQQSIEVLFWQLLSDISWSIQYSDTMQSAFVSFQITLGFMYIVWSTLYNHNVHRAISPLYRELSERLYADIIVRDCYVHHSIYPFTLISSIRKYRLLLSYFWK